MPNTDALGQSLFLIRLGIPGLNLSFSKDITLNFNVGSKYNGKQLIIKSLGENDQSWTKETSCTVTNGYCSLTTNHATYFVVKARVLPETGLESN